MGSREDGSQQSVLVARAISCEDQTGSAFAVLTHLDCDPAYAELCGDPPSQPLSPILDSVDTNGTSISRREASPSSCVFGLPDISDNAMMSEVGVWMGSQNLLIGGLVFVIIVACAIARRFK